MSAQHGSSCGRRIAIQLQSRGALIPEIVSVISRHCSVSPLRAHRIAHGYTLVEVADLLKDILRENRTPSEGLAHQTVSRWETGLDSPTERYLDALCRLYRTRPDVLGFGRDYSVGAANEQGGRPAFAVGGHPFSAGSDASAVLPQLLYGTTSRQAVEILENRVEESGYEVYTASPANFIPARMMDLASIQGLLLQGQTMNLRRRLHRAVARNAGFIGIRLTDVAAADETFGWFAIARRAARQAEDAEMEGWIAGHVSDGYSCYGQSLAQGLSAAKLAQGASGSRLSHAALFGHLAEAGIQARLGRRPETLEAVRGAQRIFDALPQEQTMADGVRIPEYFLRWHQADALSVIGEARLADPLRLRALDLPMGNSDLVGRALLGLDDAALRFRDGDVDEGSRLVQKVWDETPVDLHAGQITARTNTIISSLKSVCRATKSVRSLQESLQVIRSVSS